MDNAEQLDQKPGEQSQDQQGDQTPREPIYQVDQQSGHYGACFKLVQEKRGANPDVYQTIWTNIHNGLSDPYRGVLSTYWMAALRDIEVGEHNYKEHQLPLARIKKVMKADPEVKMISAEAPILFAKGCDIFITELTMRAWIHAEENKRRTLQRSDIAAALTKSDMFDFLIDIVPREEATASSTKRSTSQAQAAAAASQPPPSMPSQQPQPMAPPQPQHQPSQAYEQDPYHQQPEQDPYRQQSIYASHPAYAHYPPAQMAVDPSGMYTNYGMLPQQMYLQQLPPQPRQDHAGPPQAYHYSQHDSRQPGNDADGEPEDN